MRLIDADEAKLALIASKAKHMAHNEALSADEDEIMGFLDHMKTVDAVPVIRCKDCKHWQCDDDDFISRQAALDAIEGTAIVTSKESADAVIEYIRGCADRLRSLPSAQPEIIRCKDCRFFHPRSVYGHGLCDVHCNGIGESEVVRGTYFCADAERKDYEGD